MGYYTELFNHMLDEHNLLLIDQEMEEIKLICDKMGPIDYKEVLEQIVVNGHKPHAAVKIAQDALKKV